MRGQVSPLTGPWRGHILAGLLFAGLALVATWPLPADVTEAVPFSHTTAGGVGRVALFPGDTLDTLYKLWMVGEQVTGRVPLMTDPYQFQGKGITPPFVPQDFPFALLFVALSPLGIAAAYNLCLWATFVLTGLSTRWWLRVEGAGETGALLGAAIFTLLPFRLAQLKGGHFNAFVVFLLPLAAGGAAMLARGNRPVRGGMILGGSLLLMAMMEFHLFYYAALVLAVLVPLRLVGGGAAAGSPACLLHALPGTMLASGALARWSGRPVSWATLAGALGMGVAAAVLLPVILPADPSERRRALARGHLALLPLVHHRRRLDRRPASRGTIRTDGLPLDDRLRRPSGRRNAAAGPPAGLGRHRRGCVAGHHGCLLAALDPSAGHHRFGGRRGALLP